MSTLSGLDLILFGPIVLSFLSLWRGYSLAMPSTQGRRTGARDFVKAPRRRLAVQGGGAVLAGWASCVSFVYWLYFWTLHTTEGLAWSQHLHLSNVTYTCMLSLGVLAFVTQLGVSMAIESRYAGAGGDYTMSLAQLGLYLPMLTLSNTLLTLFFFMEVASTLVFYNFVATRTMLQVAPTGHGGQGGLAASKYFFNLLFFHFWVSFFSAALLLYGVVNLYLLFGTTEWSYLSFLIVLMLKQGLTQGGAMLFLAGLTLLCGFWLKLGLAPVFVYKVEVYKGLPLPTLAFYSILYFAVFGAAFVIFGGYYFALGLALLRPLAICMVAGSLLLALAMFDAQGLRNFFALSSVLTATNVVLTLLA